jgi:hypothetical protein
MLNFSNFLATWHLDAGQSEYEAGDPPRAGSYDISFDGQKLTFAMDWVDAAGHKHTLSFDGVPDGVDYPFENPAVDSVALIPVDAYNLDSVSKKDNQILAYANRKLSENGQTMYVTQSGTLPNGEKFVNKAVYHRLK